MLKEQQNYFNLEESLTADISKLFLVGAGCSHDPPSNIPLAKEIMTEIINYICPKSERQKILSFIKSDALKFEVLIEILRDKLDPQLKIIDYFEQFYKPNLHHFFLAKMILSGNFVVTTNFDSLIEQALIQSGVPKNEIIPVITQTDFEKFKNPNNLFKDGKKTIIKIHGSIKNIITNEDTRHSLIATIKALGSNKKGVNIFQVESFKRPLLDNISNHRTLIVMGYSGSDDFDIIPTLKVLPSIEKIVWINHVPENRKYQRQVEINLEKDSNLANPDKINQILIDIKQNKTSIQVIRVDLNTSFLVQSLMQTELELKPNNTIPTIKSWLNQIINPPSEPVKFQIAYRIYDWLSEVQDMFRCAEKILSYATTFKDNELKGVALNNLGRLYLERGEYIKAMNFLQNALQTTKQIGNHIGRASVLSNIAHIYQMQCKYSEALQLLQQALQIYDMSGDLFDKTPLLANIGQIYQRQGDFQKAIKFFEQALHINREKGDLREMPTQFNNIGSICYQQGNYLAAMHYYHEALQIALNLQDLVEVGISYNNIGVLYYRQRKISEARENFERALKIFNKIDDIPHRIEVLNSLGAIYAVEKKYLKARELLSEIISVVDQLTDLHTKISVLIAIGYTYYQQREYEKALKFQLDALKIAENIGDRPNKAIILNNIGEIYRSQRKFSKALKYLQKAFNLSEQLGDLYGMAVRLDNIGRTFQMQRDFHKTLHYYLEAYKIFCQMNLKDAPETQLLLKKINDVKKYLQQKSKNKN